MLLHAQEAAVLRSTTLLCLSTDIYRWTRSNHGTCSIISSANPGMNGVSGAHRLPGAASETKEQRCTSPRDATSKCGDLILWMKVSEKSRNGSLEYVPAQQKGPAGCPPARSLVDFALGWYWYSIVSLSIRPVKSQVLSFSREEPCYRFHHRRYHPVHSRASERSMNFNFSPKYFLPLRSPRAIFV